MRQTRFNTLAFSVLLAGSAGLVLLSTPARSQLGVAKGYVNLQSTTPGTAQSGHAHVSGTMRAANFVGSGAGLHSLSGDNISAGVVSGEFLPDAVAMEDEGNTFTQPNTFNGIASFNGVARFTGFTSVGRSSGALGSTESFGIGEAATGYDGMYVKTASTGRPFYGYSTGASVAWHDLNGAIWSLTVNNSTKLKVGVNGIGLGAEPLPYNSHVLNISGSSDFEGTAGGPDGILDVNQYGTGSGIQSIAWGNNGAGVLARTGNVGGWGLYADNTTSGAGTAAFCYGWGSQSTGVKGQGGAYGVIGSTSSGIGVRGESGGGYGVEGHSGVSHGVIGTSNSAEAVVGRTFAANKASVHGYTDVAGSSGGFFWSAAATGTGYGMIAQVGSANGYGVYSVGRTGASGTKSFRIDHPQDPENKYLMHYSSEGPDPLNLYSGNVVTGQDGYATVDLPDYYGDINRDPRITLTVHDGSEDFVMAKVVGNIEGNRFRIRTSKPGVKVSWLVLGVRNDAFVQTYGAPVEVDKPAAERGRYQHPELYGAQASRGMFAKPEIASRPMRPLTVEAPARIPMPKKR